MTISEAAHIKHRNIAIVDLQRKFVITYGKSIIGRQEKRFYDVVKVEL